MSSRVRAEVLESVRARNMLSTGGRCGESPWEGVIGCSLENIMGHTFTLTPDAARQDLVTFLERAARVNNGSARLVAAAGNLQVYVGILFPRGLLDRTPTVLGLRVFTVEENQDFDVVVPIDALVARAKAALERDEKALGTPAITPPREGWRRRLGVASPVLATAAAEGIARVAEAVPGSIGESVLQKVRAEVWGSPIAHNKKIPAGAAFAADALGFLGDKNLQVHTLDNWLRLSSKSGYVMVKFPGGHDFGPDDED
jgi:hypothetical protein